MAAPTDTFTTGAAIGQRESLHDRIYMLDKDDFPFQSAVGSGKAEATYEEWQTDTLGNASSTNYNLEGDDSTNVAVVPTVRVGNRTQIFKKVFQISRTEEQVKKAGRDSEISYQTAKQGRQIKMDIETSLLLNQASNAESGATPRKLGGFLSWLSSNVSRGSGGSSGGFSSGNTVAATNGTQRTSTEALLQAVIKSAWDNGGSPDTVLVSSAQKQVMSGFTGIATQYQQAGGQVAKIVAAADVYISDFGRFKIVPSRFTSARDNIVLDPGMASVLWLSKIKREELAKTGDATKYHLVGELTLKMNNQAAHGVVADLS
jgi:hypothetical protein